MRGEMNSFRFDILNRRENKFCSQGVSFQLHFKITRVLMDMRQHFILASVYMIFYRPK